MFNTLKSLLGSLRTWKVFTGISIHLPDMIKLKSMNYTGTRGLQSFKVHVISSLLIMT